MGAAIGAPVLDYTAACERAKVDGYRAVTWSDALDAWLGIEPIDVPGAWRSDIDAIVRDAEAPLGRMFDARFSRRFNHYRHERGMSPLTAWRIAADAMRLLTLTELWNSSTDTTDGAIYRVTVDDVAVNVCVSTDDDAWSMGEHPAGDESIMWTYADARAHASRTLGMARDDAHRWAVARVAEDVETWADDDSNRWDAYYLVGRVNRVDYANVGGVWIDGRDYYGDDYLLSMVEEVALEAAAAYMDRRGTERTYLASI